MTARLRRVGLVMLALFGLLFVNLNYLQVLRADDLAGDNRNTRTLVEEYRRRRGSIIAGDTEIARSVETDGVYRYERRYPKEERYAHVTGYASVVYGRAELEQAADELLDGEAPEVFLRNFATLLSGEEPVGDDVVTTIRPRVQRAADEALGDRAGAVVALDPDTGEVLALVSHPSYDPNRLVGFERDDAVAYWEQTESERRNRALRELYPPGSTFKLVTAAAALEGGVDPDDTFPDDREYTPPQTSRGIPNFGGGLCNGGADLTLERALAVSCNTVFARLGNEIGPEALVEQAEAFGFNQEWDFTLPFVPSAIPGELDPPATAQSAIGQRDVRATPLQMAMVTAAIANDGVLMRPYLIERVEDFSGGTIRSFTPQPLAFPGAAVTRAVSEQTAEDLTEMMVAVVESGSGGNAAIDGVTVAGKTGTAQTGNEDAPTVWFTGFAPAEDPEIAVAVVIPDGGDVGSEATGGAVAAPVAQAVIEAALR